MSETDTLEITPEQEFDVLDFSVVNVQNIEEIDIKVQVEDMDEKTEFISYNKGLYDSDFNTLPVSLTFDDSITKATLDVTECRSPDQNWFTRPPKYYGADPRVTVPSVRDRSSNAAPDYPDFCRYIAVRLS